MDASAYQSFARREFSHFWFVGRRRIFVELLRRHLTPRQDAIVLDLGCGVGGMIESLREFGKVVGTDNDTSSLVHCRRRLDSEFFQSESFELPLRSESIDVLCAWDVLEHVPREAEAMAECFRVLKPGGTCFVSGPSYQFLYTHQDRMVRHQRRYTVTDLSRRLRNAGFAIDQASYINCFLFPLILVVIGFKKLSEAIRPPSTDESRLNSEIAVPASLNSLFTAVFSAERHVLRRASLPFGHSLVVVGRKPPKASCAASAT
ncbi:MAG: class I SAM-dependent methyltransferase [Candidatus Binatia bacterium]